VTTTVRNALSRRGATAQDKRKARSAVLDGALNAALVQAGQCGAKGAHDTFLDEEPLRSLSPVLQQAQQAAGADGQMVTGGVHGCAKVKQTLFLAKSDEEALLSNAVRAARHDESPNAELTTFLMQSSARGASKTESLLTPDGTLKQTGNKQFRNISSKRGLDAFVMDCTQTLIRSAAVFTARMGRGEGYRLNEVSLQHVEGVLDMVLAWASDLDAQWRLVVADDIPVARRLKLATQFFGAINFVLIHWHYTLTHDGLGVFFCAWNKRMVAISDVSNLDRYPTPKRLIDVDGGKRQVKFLKALSEASPDSPKAKVKGAAGFDGLLSSIGSLSAKQRKALAKQLGLGAEAAAPRPRRRRRGRASTAAWSVTSALTVRLRPPGRPGRRAPRRGGAGRRFVPRRSG